MISINPYLNFNGNCEEAFNFYKSVFGGEFADFQRFKEAPPEGQLPEAEEEWIMHVTLPISEGYVLMGSDSPSSMEQVASGNNVQLSINTTSNEETVRIFNGLSAGGKITMPLDKTFWGARFGMCVDKYGITWMVNQDLQEG